MSLPAKKKKAGRYRRKKVTLTSLQGEEITFDSASEAYRFKQLEEQQVRGVIAGLRRQPKFLIEINGQKICEYVADFEYVLVSPGGGIGARIVEDVKSEGTQRDGVYRLKKKMFEAYYGIELTEKYVRVPAALLG